MTTTCSACSGGKTVFDYLAQLPEPNFPAAQRNDVVEVSFCAGARKDFFRNTVNLAVQTGSQVVVETKMGYDIGTISARGVIATLQMQRKKYTPTENTPSILRIATEKDLKVQKQAQERVPGMLRQARAEAQALQLPMKISKVEMQGDGKKVTVYYTAENKIDFRNLCRTLIGLFLMKVEMRHISQRQEAILLGALGSCGKTLCCSSWHASTVNVDASSLRYQGLTSNRNKLNGYCGRLKCCLNYELDFYTQAFNQIPSDAGTILTDKGKGVLIKSDIFSGTMTYHFTEMNDSFDLPYTLVTQIVQNNKTGAAGNIPSDITSRNQSESIAFSSVEQFSVHPALPELSGDKKKQSRKHTKSKRHKSAKPVQNRQG